MSGSRFLFWVQLISFFVLLCQHRNYIQGGCYLAHDLLGLVVAVTDCRGAFACFWSTEVARGVAGGGAGGWHCIQWSGNGLEGSCCTSEAVDDASVSQRSGFGRIFYSAGVPAAAKSGHILQPFARLAPGEGKGGGRGAKWGAKGHVFKKSQKNIQTKNPSLLAGSGPPGDAKRIGYFLSPGHHRPQACACATGHTADRPQATGPQAQGLQNSPPAPRAAHAPGPWHLRQYARLRSTRDEGRGTRGGEKGKKKKPRAACQTGLLQKPKSKKVSRI